MDAKRRRLVTGTERIWGIWIFVLGLAIGLCVMTVAKAVVSAPVSVDPSARVVFGFVSERIVVLSVIFVILTALVLRFHVYPPLAKLYRDSPTPSAFTAHCLMVGVRAFPYAVLAGIAIGQLLVPSSGYVILFQLGIVLAVDHFVDRRRDAFIETEVGGFLGGPAT